MSLGALLCVAVAICGSNPTHELPAHKPMHLPWVHGYASTQSVRAGEEILFFFSSSVLYSVSIERIGGSIDSAADDETVHDFGPSEPTIQPIHPGSYVHSPPLHVEHVLQVTIELWIRPFKSTAPSREKQWTGVVTMCNFGSTCSMALLLSPDHKVGFYLAIGADQTFDSKFLHVHPQTLSLGEWHHIVGTWDGAHKQLWVDGQSSGTVPVAGRVHIARLPVRIGALGNTNGEADSFVDADVAHVCIRERALSEDDVQRRLSARGRSALDAHDALRCYAFDEQAGSVVADASGHGAEGRIINRGTWRIGGPQLSAEDAEALGRSVLLKVFRFSAEKRVTASTGVGFAEDKSSWDPKCQTSSKTQPQPSRVGVFKKKASFACSARPRRMHIMFPK